MSEELKFSQSASEPYVPLLPEKFATPPDHAAPLLDRYADDIKHPERSKPLEHADEPWPQPNEFKSFAMPFLPEMPTKWVRSVASDSLSMLISLCTAGPAIRRFK